jgi:prepilin-type N-terminal cleavage/methylation domain-containing protein
MKTSLKANLLKHLIGKKEEGGFTLIELLVVIIIIGILAAIALPSFLNQANKARQSEAKTYVGSMNRGQQAYRLENRTFAGDFPSLGLGIPTATEYYAYTITPAANTSATPPVLASAFATAAKATAQDPGVKHYIGAVALKNVTNADATTTAIVCEEIAANSVVPATFSAAAPETYVTQFSITAPVGAADNLVCATAFDAL